MAITLNAENVNSSLRSKMIDRVMFYTHETTENQTNRSENLNRRYKHFTLSQVICA
jgi:hypothetical protein